MTVRNQGWYSANESRPYPLDDAASGTTDDGRQLPNHILADLNLRFPDSLATAAFLGAVSVTETAVTVTILGAANNAQPRTEATELDFTPLAALTLIKPVIQHRQYALTPLQDGVGGWVTLGAGVVDTPFTGRFSTPAQSGLAARCARAFPALPVSDIGKLHTATPLSGVVQLLADSDLEIVMEEREIPIDGDVHNTLLRDVVVIRLKDTLNTGSGRNVFDLYRGPCSGRPESRTCGEPDPIEFINTVGPDCCGTFTIELQGCAIPGRVVGGGSGVVLDCGLGLSQACISQDRLPTADGTLPNEYENLCSDYSDIVPSLVEESDTSAVFNAPDESSGAGSEPLPWLETFDSLSAPLFIPITAASGGVSNWDFLGYESPYEPATAADPLPTAALASPPLGSLSTVNNVSALSARNFGYFDIDGGSWSTLGKRLVTALALDDHDGARHVAGVLVNFKLSASTPAKSTYWAVELDWDSKQLKLSYFSGFVKVSHATVSIADLALKTWYRLIVDVQADPDNSEAAWITVYVADGIPATTIAIMGPIHLSTFGAPTGTFGVIAERSWAHFSFVHVDHK